MGALMKRYVISLLVCLITSSVFWFSLTFVGASGLRMIRDVSHPPQESSVFVDTLNFGWSTFGDQPVFWLFFLIPPSLWDV